MNILINQRFGIGDCVFAVTIARNWIAEGHTIAWPVLPHFLEQLQRAYPDITWLDCRHVHADYNNQSEHDWNGYRVVPLAWANEIMGQSYDNCMRNKYDLLGLDFNTWRDKAMWKRDKEREEAHFNSFYGNKKGYALVNEFFGSDSKMTKGITPATDLPVLFMQVYNGVSIFDWAKVLENATEIHTVSTSLLYILELLDINCPIHLYPRPSDPKFKQVDYLFTKPYILH